MVDIVSTIDATNLRASAMKPITLPSTVLAATTKELMLDGNKHCAWHTGAHATSRSCKDTNQGAGSIARLGVSALRACWTSMRLSSFQEELACGSGSAPVIMNPNQCTPYSSSSSPSYHLDLGLHFGLLTLSGHTASTNTVMLKPHGMAL